MLGLNDRVRRARAWLAGRATVLWSHRTKIVGALGMVAGGLEGFLEDHPAVHLPHRGLILIVFGAVVTLVGLYNRVRTL